jgi:predicted PurR-regulated permease PerM
MDDPEQVAYFGALSALIASNASSSAANTSVTASPSRLSSVTPTPSATPPSSSNSSSVSGAVIGGVVGGVLAFITIIGALFFFYRHRKKLTEKLYASEEGDHGNTASRQDEYHNLSSPELGVNSSQYPE